MLCMITASLPIFKLVYTGTYPDKLGSWRDPRSIGWGMGSSCRILGYYKMLNLDDH